MIIILSIQLEAKLPAQLTVTAAAAPGAPRRRGNTMRHDAQQELFIKITTSGSSSVAILLISRLYAYKLRLQRRT